MEMSFHACVDEAVLATHREFQEYPFDYTSSEREAEFRLYQRLKESLPQGRITVYRTDGDCPCAPYDEIPGERTRLEFALAIKGETFAPTY